jgi:predicted DNA-binding transcriptional regulator AlpA
MDEQKSFKLIRGVAGLRALGITLGTTQLWEDVKEGRFPAPIKLNENGRSLFWLESEILEWLEIRKRARDEALAALREASPAPAE